MLAVIIPTLNSEKDLTRLLENIDGQADKIIVSDGGSTDETLIAALGSGAVIARGAPGRGQQLRRATTLAVDQDWLLFLHADCQMAPNWRASVNQFIQTHPDKAGYFDLRFDSSRPAARWVEAMVRLRCWAWGLPYGDQGLLISRDLYADVGEFQNMALFEDVDMVRRIRKARLRRIGMPITTSADKYERDGYFRRGWRNLKLLARFLKGEPVEILMKDYS